MKSEMQLQHAALLWEDLMRASKSDPSTRHVYHFFKLTKTKLSMQAQWRWRAGEAAKAELPRHKIWDGIQSGDLKELSGCAAYSGLEWYNVLASMPPDQVSALTEEEKSEIKARAKTWQKIVLLQTFFRDLLGSGFRFYLGILDSPTLDLFLWFVLCHRPGMATIFWRYCKQPILTAVMAAHMCRAMAKHNSIQEASVAGDMRQTAAYFETIAIRVYEKAFDNDVFLARDVLEQPLPLFPGLKLLDLAYTADCFEFLSVCCAREIDRRFAGDLLHTNHHLILPGLGTRISLSVDVAVIVCFLSLGLLAPLLLTFHPPGFCCAYLRI